MLMSVCSCQSNVRIPDLIKRLSFVGAACAHTVHSQPWSGVDLLWLQPGQLHGYAVTVLTQVLWGWGGLAAAPAARYGHQLGTFLHISLSLKCIGVKANSLPKTKNSLKFCCWLRLVWHSCLFCLVALACATVMPRSKMIWRSVPIFSS